MSGETSGSSLTNGKGLQYSEGVLLLTRPKAEHQASQPPVAPPSDVALPTKNNQVLSESLQIVKGFRQQIDQQMQQQAARP